VGDDPFDLNDEKVSFQREKQNNPMKGKGWAV